MRSTVALCAGCKGFGEQSSEDIRACAPFFCGDLVYLSDGFGAEADGVVVSWHAQERSTSLHGVGQRATFLGMETARTCPGCGFKAQSTAGLIRHQNRCEKYGHLEHQIFMRQRAARAKAKDSK